MSSYLSNAAAMYSQYGYYNGFWLVLVLFPVLRTRTKIILVLAIFICVPVLEQELELEL